jgi:superfamily II DNA or RNA helicase
MLRVMRMKALMEYPSKELYTKKLMESISTKCIVFANTQAQADKLCPYSYHSNNKESEDNLLMFKEGKIDKLSTVLQLNEGVNIPNLKQGIIMHAYGNERKAAQRIGRLLRLNPDDKAIVHILCYMDTVDEKWVKEALENFDQTKIIWKDFNISLY